MRPLESILLPPFSGDSLARAQQALDLAAWVLEAAWGSSAGAARWLAGRVQGGARVREARPRWPEELRGGALDEVLRREGRYAASTRRRYGQIVERFTRWYEREDSSGEDAGMVARFLAETSECWPGSGGRRDPRHLGLRRTTLSCIRSTVDRLGGRALAAGTRLAARPRRWEPVAAETVVRLEQAAGPAGRERLLVALCVGVGLRVGQMAALRRRDLSRGCRQVWYLGRAGRRQKAVVPPDCRRVLACCVKGCGPGDWLFPSAAGDGAGPLSVRALQRRLAALVQRAGVPAGVRFEALRRSGSGAAARAPVGLGAGERGARVGVAQTVSGLKGRPWIGRRAGWRRSPSQPWPGAARGGLWRPGRRWEHTAAGPPQIGERILRQTCLGKATWGRHRLSGPRAVVTPGLGCVGSQRGSALGLEPLR